MHCLNKIILFFLVVNLISWPIEIIGQEDKETIVKYDSDEILEENVNKKPRYPGGASGLMDYLNASIRYPQNAFANNHEGTINIAFIVELDGTISNVKPIGILRTQDEILKLEAIRVVESIPKKFKPAKLKGKKVRCVKKITVNFILHKK